MGNQMKGICTRMGMPRTVRRWKALRMGGIRSSLLVASRRESACSTAYATAEKAIGNRQRARDTKRLGPMASVCSPSTGQYCPLPVAGKKRYGAVLLAPRRIYHHSREGG